MGIADKANNAAERAAGGVKEKVGDVTNDDELKAEGQADQTKSDLKDAGEKIKDAFGH